MRRRLPLAGDLVAAVARGTFVRVDLDEEREVAEGVRARSVLVGKWGGSVRAYANICRHQPIPLDSGLEDWPERGDLPEAPMDDDRRHLFCVRHGAVYRVDDGVCVGGPCEGESLARVAIEEAEGITLLLP